MMLERLLLILIDPAHEMRPYVFTVRLLAFILILAAILDKNRNQAPARFCHSTGEGNKGPISSDEIRMGGAFSNPCDVGTRREPSVWTPNGPGQSQILSTSKEKARARRLLAKHDYWGDVRAVGEQLFSAITDACGDWLGVLIFCAASRRLRAHGRHRAQPALFGQRPRGHQDQRIPGARQLFQKPDLDGRKVSLDALHTQDQSARELVLEHGADYLLTVKDNQPTRRANIQRLVTASPADFSPLGRPRRIWRAAASLTKANQKCGSCVRARPPPSKRTSPASNKWRSCGGTCASTLQRRSR